MTLRLSRLRKPQLPPIHHVQVVEAATASGPASEEFAVRACSPSTYFTAVRYSYSHDPLLLRPLHHRGLFTSPWPLSSFSLSRARALFLCTHIHLQYLAYRLHIQRPPNVCPSLITSAFPTETPNPRPRATNSHFRSRWRHIQCKQALQL